ncbi:M20/M25/M40 family metallo-hydrolase [bacterium]|nr:MAG: M20/M25/M40 family metallo-hydrolase [bacterium]
MKFSKKLGFTVLGLLPTAAIAQETPAIPSVPADAIARIRAEGMNNSKVMATAQVLCDRFGARLTGSQALLDANAWTRDEMASWGMQAKLEAWGPFGRSWELQRTEAQVAAPYVAPLIAVPKAWSPPTAGRLDAEVVIFDPVTDTDYQNATGKLRGKIVLTSKPRELKPEFEPRASRRTDEELQKMAVAPVPTPTATPTPAPNAAPSNAASVPTAAAQRLARKLNFLREQGAALLLDNSNTASGGTVFTASALVPQDKPLSKPTATGRTRLLAQDAEAEGRVLPQMTLATENYNQLYRLVASGQKVRIRAQIASKFGGNARCFNTIAEIPGSDLKDQIVMLGGHMDSWQGSTGATDNAAGVSVAMEAARILLATGLKPRRTIRVALWTGEEEGLLGSAAYVNEHFGRIDTKGTTKTFVPGPEYEKLAAYYNLDNGGGKARGIFAQGNTAAAPYFKSWLSPLADLGAGTTTLSNTGSTDHISFDRIGLPGFQFIQDRLEYFTFTHHSNQDNYDRLQEDDLKQLSVVMATMVYQTAMMDERFPRKPFTP